MKGFYLYACTFNGVAFVILAGLLVWLILPGLRLNLLLYLAELIVSPFIFALGFDAMAFGCEDDKKSKKKNIQKKETA